MEEIKKEIERLLNSSRFSGDISNLINSLARDKKMRFRIENITSYIDKYHQSTKKVPKAPMSMRIYCILNNIIEEDIPKCKCGKPKAFDSMERGFRLSCGNRSCYQSLPEVVRKKHKTVMENFGSLKKGYENSITMKRKYGAENCSQLDWVKEKKIETSRKNWGADYPWQTEEGKRRQKEGVQSKWNVDNISQHDDIKQKKVETSRKNWNYDNPSQHPYVRSRILGKNGYPYKLPSGNIVIVDSINEEISIKFLLEQFSENQIIVQPNLAIKYQDINRNKHIWFPDILVTSDRNKLIEVKTHSMMNFDSSNLWYQLHGGINSGYTVELFVVNEEKIYIFIPLENENTWKLISHERDPFIDKLFIKLDKYNFFIEE